MLTGYRKNLIAVNFTNCNLILGKQITEITSARQDLSSAFYTECNDSFSDDTVKTTYSNMSAICTDLYNANVENSIDLGRTRTRLYNDDTEYSEKILEIVDKLEEMQCVVEDFSNKMYSGTNNGEAYKIVTSPYQSINPQPVMDGPIFVQGPTLIYSKEFNGDYFDWADAFAGLNNMSIDDMTGAMPNAIPTTNLGANLMGYFCLINLFRQVIRTYR